MSKPAAPATPPAEPVDDVITPGMDDVEQQPAPELATIPVRVEGPVKVQTPPALHGSHRSFALDATTVHEISGADRRRGRLILILIGDPATDFFLVGTSQESVRTGVGQAAVPWPAREPLVIRHSERVFVRGGVAGPLNLGVITELWAD